MTDTEHIVGRKLKWSDGGDAWIVDTDGVKATLHSTRRAPVGSPLSATLTMADPSAPEQIASTESQSTTSVTVSFKVKDCRRLGTDMYLLSGRWVSLSQPVRERLLSTGA